MPRMTYVDGYLVPLATKHLAAYRRIAKAASKLWLDHGALDYRECAGDDFSCAGVVAFPKALAVKRGETVVFAWVVFKSRAHRDRVNKAVMQDPRLAKMVPEKMPFDCTRIVYGGFKTIVGG